MIQTYLTVKHANGLVFDMFGGNQGNHYTIKHDNLTLKEQRLSLSGVVSTSLVIISPSPVQPQSETPPCLVTSCPVENLIFASTTLLCVSVP